MDDANGKLESQVNERMEELIDFYHMSDTDSDETAGGSYPLHAELTNLDFRYDVKELVARGGGKQIFCAEDMQTGRDIALAQMFAEDAKDQEKREAFLREARLTAVLQHPNIMPVYDVGLDEDEIPFFTMKLMRGDTLADVLKKIRFKPKYREKYTRQVLIDIFVKVCEAVAYAHANGVLHLDLKPENIMVGEFGEVLVADWGLGKVISEPDRQTADGLKLEPAILSSITINGVVKGTIGYMAPELFDSSLGVKSPLTDVFSLGALLYTMLTTLPPIKAESLKECQKKLFNSRIIPPSERAKQAGIPASLDAICMKSMALRPADRYQNVLDVITDLHAYQGGFATEAENAGLLKAIFLFVRRHKYFSLFLAFLIIAVYVVKLQQRDVQEAEMQAAREKERLRQEKVEAKQFFKHTLMDNVDRIYSDFVTNTFDTNQALLSYLEKVGGNDNRLVDLKFKLLFIENKFDEAIKLAGNKKVVPAELIALAKSYRSKVASSGRLALKDSLELCDKLHFSGRVPLAIQYGSNCIKNLNEADSAVILKKMLRLHNSALPENFNLKLKRRGDKLIVDLSGNPKLVNLDPLVLLPIEDLDIYGSKVLSADKLAFLPLVKVRMNGRILRDWRPLLEIKTLRTLVVTEDDLVRMYLPKFKEKGVLVVVKN